MNFSTFVLDASALATSVLKPDSAAAHKLHVLTANRKNKFISPKLFIFEFGNIVRYNTPAAEVSGQIMASVKYLPINLVDLVEPDLLKILSLSWELGQSYHDCSYLHLALLNDCLMLTCDKKFFRAAAALEHVELWD